MELETVVSLSRTELLREVIIEKLTVAAQQIFAVVERTVAAYEEEASGFRKEIERHRRQLEVVLQPEIKVEITDDQLFPVCELGQAEAPEGGRERDGAEEQHKYEPSVGFICYAEEQMTEDEGDEEVEESSEQPALIPTQDQEHHTELLYETASKFGSTLPAHSQNLSTPSVQAGGSAGRLRIIEPQNHVDLKIRILEDYQIQVLSTSVFKKYPAHQLQCPCGLQEADFLNLLRSTFPQLAADQPFDTFITDKSKKLQPLKVKTLTPEEITGFIRSSGAGHSSLYIRLKELEEPRATDEELDPSQRKEAAADPPDETRPHTGVQPLKKKRRFRRQKETQTQIKLKIRVLEDSQIKKLTSNEFKKYPGHWLQCPRGLQEADFLHLLRSTFPQLASDQPFDIFVTDKSRILQPLKVNTLTPEEIYAGIRSSGAGHSSLYIRLKELEEPRATDDVLDPSQRKEAAADPPDETRPHTGYLSPRVLLLKKKRLSCQNQTRTHVNLKIRFLEDCRIKKLAFSAFKTYPCHWLKCPRGLQEADFLYLLRSTFPQLASDQPFDIFVTDKSRILQPLKVNTLTPEEIYAGIRSSGAGNSSLYIRLKELEELRATDEEFDPAQRKETSSDSPDETTPDMGLSSPRVYQTEPQTHIEIRVLEDSQIDALDLSVFQKYSAKELRFPCGLQEADFLNQLRSTFPQLAADKCFDVFTTDQSRKLQPLKVNALTPEELYRTIRTTGNSDLYIRLKKKDADDKDSQSTADQTTHGSRVQSDKRKPGRPPRFESQGYIDINIRLLDNLPTGALAGRGLRKYPVQQLQCPCGLKEAGFMDLLRSTFPQLAADFEILVLNKARKLIPLEVNEVTPEEIYRIMRTHGLSAVYVKLKDQEEAQASAEDPAKYSPSTSDEARLHSSISVQKEVDSTDDVSINSQLDTETEEAKGNDEESASLWSMFLSKSETDEAEENDGDHDWKPDKSDSYLRNGESEETTKKRRVKHSDVKTNRRKRIQLTDDSNAPLSCKVCRVLHKSTNKLIKHAWSHVYNPERRCGVCGEGSESAEELRSHLQGHLKTHSCSICGKSFLSTSGLKGHVARHKAETPYKCKTCHKAFTEKSALNNHKELHTQSHADEKLYSCSTCRKSFRRFETLSQHMASQSCLRQGGERTYVCEICNRHFYTNKKLQAHMSSHTSERQYTCRICNKQFPGKTHLVVHMRVHTG
uniref:C2H2-type domain-containing protein n=1 Tax=Anabas testudineus TaxID=64144 RepID=A0AAQ6IUR5_ANATE